MSTPAAEALVLPPSVISRADISRIARELEGLENELEAQRVRGDTKGHLPVLSATLSEFLAANGLDVLNGQTRLELAKELRHLKDKAPIVHLTFATEIEPQLLQQLTAWIREQLHPQGLVTIGLQPGLVGGVYIRTPNQVHDFSLKALLKDKHPVMIRQIEALHGR